MRILVDGLANRSGGGMTVLVGLCSELSRSDGVDVELLVRPDVVGELPPDLRSRVLSRTGIERIGRRLVWQQTALPLFAHRRGADVLFGLSNIVPLVAPRIPTAVLVQNTFPLHASARRRYGGKARIRMEVLRAMTLASVMAANAVYVLSHAAAADIRGRSSTRTVVVLPPGGGAEGGDGMLRERDPNLVVVVSDLYRHKGIEDCIDALLDPRLGRLRVEVCGAPIEGDYYNQLVAHTRRTGVADRVWFRGRVEHSEVLNTLARARCLVFPSRVGESLGLPIIEALSVGTPVIAAETPTSREVGGERSSYYSAGDSRALATAIADLDASKVARGIPAGSSWETTAATLASSLRSVVG